MKQIISIRRMSQKLRFCPLGDVTVDQDNEMHGDPLHLHLGP